MLQKKCFGSISLSNTDGNLTQNIYTFYIIVFLAEQPGAFNYTVVNDDLEKAYTDLKDIISKVCNITISVNTGTPSVYQTKKTK